MLPHCSAQSTSKGLCLFAMFAPYPFGLSKVRYLGCCRGPLCCDDIRLSDVRGVVPVTEGCELCTELQQIWH